MDLLDNKFVNEIAEKCIEIYNKLPKTGKPIDKEWTVLSCVVKLENKNNFEVVSLGTGSKCIGATKMCSKGLILNDSHAEIMARRGFLVYLYKNIEKTIQKQPSIFILENGKYILRNNIQFVFYSSQLPCGDASIISKSEDEQDVGDVINSMKRHAEDEISETACKSLKLCHDIHRTGAKCLHKSDQDPKKPGKGYHILGQVRTKPGRGDRTLSVSCSDKIARWIHLGIQGSLLDMLLHKPIYIKHFIFGANVPYSEEALNRAFLYRNGNRNDIPLKLDYEPKFYQSSVVFTHLKTEERVRPTPGSILWINLDSVWVKFNFVFQNLT